jgi:hypothetical protein
MIVFVGTLQLIPIITAHNQWLSKTRSIPCWTTSVFSSTVTNLVLIYESVTSPASVVRWLTLHSWTLNFWILLRLIWKTTVLRLNRSQSQSHIATDGQSISKSWCRAPSGLMIRYLLLFDSLVFVGRPLWREDGSAFCVCCWPSPAQSVSGPSPLGLVTVFYCLRFETSLSAASCDSQGHGWGIRPRLHTGPESFFCARLLIYSAGNHGECLLPGCCHGNMLTEPLPINELKRLFVAAGTCVLRAVG